MKLTRHSPVSRAKAFSLIEAVFAMMVVGTVGLAVIGAVIFSRQSMEIQKQRLAALNYCRQTLEAAQTNASIDAGTKTLVPFNAPGLEIEANVSVVFFQLNSDGSVNWGSPQMAAPHDAPALCRVRVEWTPAGSMSRPQMVSMSSIVRVGTT
jgi:type II secretory pathway pseudopilin PulG